MTYSSIDKFVPSGNVESKNVLDLWIVAKFNELVAEVTKSLDKYDSYKASNLIVEFVNELSTWYVRRSRRRFWKSESGIDKTSAYETLYSVLTGLVKLLAPFVPMYSELLYKDLRCDSDPESVHLADYPTAPEANEDVLAKMAQTRRIVEAGLAARAEAKIKVRQPLQTLTYFGQKLDAAFEGIIAEEVNVKAVKHSTDKSGTAVTIDTNITPELKEEGTARDLIRNIQSLRKKSGFEVEDRIEVFYESTSELLLSVMKNKQNIIAVEVLAEKIEAVRSEIDG